jgi:hypothetical protein
MKKRSTFAPAFENNNVLWQTSKAVQLRVSEKKYIFDNNENKFGNSESSTVHLPPRIKK